MATSEPEQGLIRAHLHALADRLEDSPAEVTARLIAQMSSRIDALPHDPPPLELLHASVAINLENLARCLRGEITGDVLLPAATEEYARHLAHLDSSPGALLRAHRLGQMSVIAWARDVTGEIGPDSEVALAATQTFVDTTFAYTDAVFEGVMDTYQRERDQWQANRIAVRRETVAALLSGAVDDVDLAEQALGHRLRQHHLGVLLWCPDGSLTTSGLQALEHHLTRFARALHCDSAPLFLPRGGSLAWGWLLLDHHELADLAERLEAVEPVPGIAFAIGTPAAGAEGFRATHEEALAAHRVAQLGAEGSDANALTWYGDPGVRAAALLAVDLPHTRRMVRRTLSGLAADTEANARLRETLLVFLQARESYVSAAARLHLHKNTVRYRVERAVHLRGRPLDEDRLDLELALHACAWLSSHVLVTRP